MNQHLPCDLEKVLYTQGPSVRFTYYASVKGEVHTGLVKSKSEDEVEIYPLGFYTKV